VTEGVSTGRPRVTAIVLSHERMRELSIVLDALAELPVDEVIVSGDGSGEAASVVARHALGRGSWSSRVLISERSAATGLRRWLRAITSSC
jgi:hypothetical protein